jgi:hypothetical protein
MKILLLATPRSGSTSLVKFIDSHINLLNHKMIIEPFNRIIHPNNKRIDTIQCDNESDSILIKNLFLLENDEYPIESFNDVYGYLDWCYSYFDKVIILDRKDKIAQSESFVINETMYRENKIDWHTQKIYDLDRIDKVFLDTMINKYIESSKILFEISKSQNLPIFYYEDIFLEHNINVVKNLLEYLDMDLILENYNEFILSPYRRVRVSLNNFEKKMI